MHIPTRMLKKGTYLRSYNGTKVNELMIFILFFRTDYYVDQADLEITEICLSLKYWD